MKSFAVKVNKHPLRKNNVQVNVMYELYLDGRSLRQIGAMFHKHHRSIQLMFRSRGYETRSKQLKGLQVIDGHRFTFNDRGYLRATINGKRIYAQQYVWEKHHGPVPAGQKVFHIDGDKTNNAIENLKLIAKSGTFPPVSECPRRGPKSRKLSLIERVRAEREERWKRAMAI